MNRKKAIFITLICLVMAVFANGCGAEDEPVVVKDYQDQPQVTLSIFTNATLVDHLWDQGFIAADGAQLNIVEYSSDYYEQEKLSYREVILKRLQSNVDIDCYIIHAEDVIQFSQLNYWLDLSGTPAAQVLSEDALRQSTYGGRVFSIPLTYTGFGFYWNVDLLREHGLAVPANREEFLSVCESLKQAGVTPYLGTKGYALTVPAMAVGFAGLYSAENSADLLADLAQGKTPVSQYMAEGFAFIELMVDRGYLDPEYALNTAPMTTEREDFLAGKGACMCGLLQPMDGVDFELALTGIPVLEEGAVAVVGANHRLAVNPNSPRLDYALEMLNGIVDSDWLATIAAAQQGLSSGAGDYDRSYMDPRYEDFVALVQSGGQIPNQDFSLSFNTWEAIRDLCREICAGATAAEVTEKYDLIQQEQIAEYGG